MTSAGLKSVELAKQNGSWTILDQVEELVIPTDLATAFEKYSGKGDYFLSLSKTTKKMLLQWLVLAKRPETRHKRLLEIIENARQGKIPPQFKR